MCLTVLKVLGKFIHVLLCEKLRQLESGLITSRYLAARRHGLVVRRV